MSNKPEVNSQFNQKLMDEQEIEKQMRKWIPNDIFCSEIQGCVSFQTPQIETKREIQTGPELKQNENDQRYPEQMAIAMQIPKISNSNQNPQPTKPNPNQPQFKGILSKKKIKKMPKNSNVIRYFNKFYILRCTRQKYMRFFQGQPVILRQVKKFIQQQKRGYRQMKNWNHNIDSMIKIFGLVEDSSNPAQRSLIMRKIAHQMIYQEMIPEVLNSQKIEKKMKKCYIYTLRILSRRCSNNLLMTRTQI